MTKQDAGGRRIAYLVLVAAALVWGILGVMDISSTPYTGYITTAQSVLNQVQAGSPAEAAGMQVGDRITSIGGIAIEDTRALNRAPRTLPGDAREIGLERDGQSRTVMLTYASQPGGQRAISWAAALLGFAFILVPLIANGLSPSVPGRYLTWFGLCFGLSFLPAVYLSSAVARNVATAAVLVAIVFGFALLLRFALAFPRDTAPAKQSAQLLIWGPAAVIALLFVYLLIGEPDSTSGLNSFVNILVGLFVVGYFGATLVVLFRKYRSTAPAQRAGAGLGLVVWGAVVALVPLLIASIMNLVSPMTVLPGQQYYFLALGIIPIAFSLAVLKVPAVQPAAA
jgi:membrane-associated protease RseP (regulator of RpoE activity)